MSRNMLQIAIKLVTFTIGRTYKAEVVQKALEQRTCVWWWWLFWPSQPCERHERERRPLRRSDSFLVVHT